MSLFGDDDQPSRPKQTPSLFDDDPKPAHKSSNSLFADDVGDDSPWGIPTPKKAARGSLVKSLLPVSDVPEAYIDTYDVLLEQGDGAVHLSAAKKLLRDSGLPEDAQTRILGIVSQPGHEHDD